MKRAFYFKRVLAVVAALAIPCTLRAAEPTPLIHAHAHNDYNHTHPLMDALSHGFCSVEADVHLVDGQLLVAHDLKAVKPGRTLQSLYLDPLRERVKTNGGSVFPGGPEVILLVDLKGDWKESYPVLRNILKQYSDMLVTFQDGTKKTNAVRAIVTGNRARQMFAGETVRYASLDGELINLKPGDTADLFPWISSNWKANFKWDGKGEMPAEERAKLKDIVARAHQQGKRVRFWGGPDQPVFWGAMLANGVDLINTDHLAEAQKFLLQQ